jgi:hypothetical protein
MSPVIFLIFSRVFGGIGNLTRAMSSKYSACPVRIPEHVIRIIRVHGGGYGDDESGRLTPRRKEGHERE